MISSFDICMPIVLWIPFEYAILTLVLSNKWEANIESFFLQYAHLINKVFYIT